MADETSETSWGTIGIILAALAAVAFSVATNQGGELTLVLRGAGALLLVGGLVALYWS